MSNKPSVSFEFFPPKSDKAKAQLKTQRDILAKADPSYFSITYGAGGTTRDNTLETLLETIESTGIDCAPHLSCIGETREHLIDLINIYKDHGIRRIVALRGDLPSGSGVVRGDFNYAQDLVRLIKDISGDHFMIEVGAYPEMHPQAKNFEKDFQYFVDKVEAGASSAITQYFYNADAYEHFMNRCAQKGLKIPVVPGIMPITNFSRLARFSEMCGAEIPRWLEKQLMSYGDDLAAIRSLGEEVVTRLVDQLIHLGAPSFHFYTLNQAEPSLKICRNLNLITTV